MKYTVTRERFFSPIIQLIPNQTMSMTNLHNRTSCPQLRHDAASAPHIDRRTVVAFSEQQLRRPVPQRHHARRVAIRAVVVRRREETGEAEVSQFEDPASCEKDVGGLHVSMQDVVTVRDNFELAIGFSKALLISMNRNFNERKSRENKMADRNLRSPF